MLERFGYKAAIPIVIKRVEPGGVSIKMKRKTGRSIDKLDIGELIKIKKLRKAR